VGAKSSGQRDSDIGRRDHRFKFAMGPTYKGHVSKGASEAGSWLPLPTSPPRDGHPRARNRGRGKGTIGHERGIEPLLSLLCRGFVRLACWSKLGQIFLVCVIVGLGGFEGRMPSPPISKMRLLGRRHYLRVDSGKACWKHESMPQQMDAATVGALEAAAACTCSISLQCAGRCLSSACSTVIMLIGLCCARREHRENRRDSASGDACMCGWGRRRDGWIQRV
jgi:hypothetical protein